jgi:hypothetical protein
LFELNEVWLVMKMLLGEEEGAQSQLEANSLGASRLRRHSSSSGKSLLGGWGIEMSELWTSFWLHVLYILSFMRRTRLPLKVGR